MPGKRKQEMFGIIGGKDSSSEDGQAFSEHKAILSDPEDEYVKWYPESRKYSRQELCLDGAVNTLGVVLSLVGAPCLILHSRAAGDEWLKTEALLVYSICLCCMLTFSLLFNSFAWSERWFPVVQALDLVGIYFMIAGTYTPVLVQSQCWPLLIIVWSIAGMGCLWQAYCFGIPIKKRPFPLDIVLFMLMGWSLVPFFRRVTPFLSNWSCTVIVVLGVIYTIGAYFNSWQELRYHKPIWHSAVLVATSLTYVICYVEISGGAPIGTEWRYVQAEKWD
eukprot:TRINITY_DN29011_c0_g1_i1.p1 TRINITY_DN29011_c0_g1~~TRINITY_DN29011_c0_g1_i1.p1  ORF type:complete len:277 (-),score=44.81 TRINITY_DN29011_c0_g1_i1:25-855(-)